LLINGLADEIAAGPLAQIVGAIDPCEDCAAFISKALTESPPITVTEGGIIRAGYSEELDDINNRSQSAREWIAGLEAKERQRTGISNLKVGFNKVFGYFLEVSSSNISKVPKEYIRKQTITNGERYITPELKEYETLVLNAQERCNKLEMSCSLRCVKQLPKNLLSGLLKPGNRLPRWIHCNLLRKQPKPIRIAAQNLQMIFRCTLSQEDIRLLSGRCRIFRLCPMIFKQTLMPPKLF